MELSPGRPTYAGPGEADFITSKIIINDHGPKIKSEAPRYRHDAIKIHKSAEGPWMFTTKEIKTNLLGALECALFMPVARTRFGKSYEEALRSFMVPSVLFPLSLLIVYLYPEAGLTQASANKLALLYSLRLAVSWVLFLGSVYWLLKKVDREEHFSQFVVASNWLAVPATIVILPVLWMVMTGGYSGEQIQPFMTCVMLYTYGFTAFMACYVLRVPMELAAFINVISFMINDYTGNVVHYVGSVL